MLGYASSRISIILFASTLLILTGTAAPPVSAQAQATPTDFTAIVRQKAPAVVGVGTTETIRGPRGLPESFPEVLPFGDQFRFDDGRLLPRQAPERVRQALGAGFIISQDGHIVTNNHVVGNAEEIRIIFSDGTAADARLVGRDSVTDIAVIKIEPRPNMAVVAWGDSEKMEPGAWTIAIGSPFGLGGTVTVGVLSARSRDIQGSGYGEYLQTDASINRGNSGGPLFNATGDVIGVNTAILSPVGANIGIGFAVPSRIARDVSDQIIRTGQVERGYVGLRLQEITPSIAHAMGLDSQDAGSLVASVERNGPADKAGIRAGDVITRFGDQKVQGTRDLSRAVAAAKPGTEVAVAVLRGGSTEELKVAVGQRGGDAQARRNGPSVEEEQGARLGLVLSPIPEQARGRLGLESGGVLVQRVQPNSPAADTGIRPGDVIVSAGQRSVDETSDVAEAWADARQQKKALLLRLKRDDQYMFVAVAES